MPLDESAGLSVKEETLAGLAASIAAGCRPCTRRWLHESRVAGACERGIRLAIETGLSVRTSATSAMADFAASIQAGAPELDDTFRSERARLTEVFACGAALSLRSTENLKGRIDSARQHGATGTQIGAVFAIARAVCATAGEEVEKVVRRAGLEAAPKLAGKWCCEALSVADPAPPAGCGCGGGRT
jgi:alkylhydroperoxidase/carboxymuconolactone decarboxylase family protein YurZ